MKSLEVIQGATSQKQKSIKFTYKLGTNFDSSYWIISNSPLIHTDVSGSGEEHLGVLILLMRI